MMKQVREGFKSTTKRFFPLLLGITVGIVLTSTVLRLDGPQIETIQYTYAPKRSKSPEIPKRNLIIETKSVDLQDPTIQINSETLTVSVSNAQQSIRSSTNPTNTTSTNPSSLLLQTPPPLNRLVHLLNVSYAQYNDHRVCRPRYPQIVIYNRIPKAGSTTTKELIWQLQEQNTFDFIIPTPKHNHSSVITEVVRALVNGGPTIIAEHFHFPDFHLTPWVEYFNILRDPVDRCVSTYYFSRYGPRHADSKIATLDSYGDININQCFNSTKLGQKPACWNCGTNTMASFFCGADGGGCQHLDRDERLGRAYANLQTYTVGITEYLEESMELLEHRFPAFFRGAKELYKTMPPQKVTAGNVHYEKPTEETRLKIEALLKSDREIYDIAKAKFLREYRECVKGIIEEEDEVGDGWAKEEEEEDDESVGEDSAPAPV